MTATNHIDADTAPRPSAPVSESDNEFERIEAPTADGNTLVKDLPKQRIPALARVGMVAMLPESSDLGTIINITPTHALVQGEKESGAVPWGEVSLECVEPDLSDNGDGKHATQPVGDGGVAEAIEIHRRFLRAWNELHEICAEVGTQTKDVASLDDWLSDIQADITNSLNRALDDEVDGGVDNVDDEEDEEDEECGTTATATETEVSGWTIATNGWVKSIKQLARIEDELEKMLEAAQAADDVRAKLEDGLEGLLQEVYENLRGTTRQERQDREEGGEA